MESYLLLVLADILLAANFAINKVYQQKNGVALKTGLYFNCLSGLFTVLIFFVISGFKLHISVFSLIMAVVQTVLVTVYTLISFRVLKYGTLALYTLFLMSGGMTVPYIWGLLFLNEEFSFIRTAALILIIIAVTLSNLDGKKTDKKQFLMCLSVFLLNGFVSVVSKIHQIEQNYTTVNSSEFVFWGGVFKFLIAGVIYLAVKSKEESPKAEITQKNTVMAVVIIAAAALVSGVSYLLQLLGAVDLPATVLYPFVTGGSIIFSSITGVIFFKDKLNLRIIISVILCFIGTLMFL
ncbi:MAG: EamA family transporter [Clostridia bacterium]|nr:EamA family transporter [Clostridia bacterium]